MPESLVKFGSPVTLPLAWADLLAIKNFEDYEKDPNKTVLSNHGQPIPADAKQAYRDDNRWLMFRDGTYQVFATLYSGNNNYWMEYTVFLDVMEGPNVDLPIHKDKEPEQKVKQNVRLALTTGVTLDIDVSLATE